MKLAAGNPNLKKAAQPPLPVQEPDELTIAYLSGLYDGKKKRQWVGLTDEEVEHIADSEWEEAFVRLIEAKLKEKNT